VIAVAAVVVPRVVMVRMQIAESEVVLEDEDSADAWHGEDE
jgi:hypothetical protein